MRNECLKKLPLSLRLMAEFNRLFKIQNIFKTGAFTFRFETLPPLSCLSHLTRLVCLTSLFLSVSPHSSCLSHLTLLVCLTSLFLSVSSTHSPHVINEIWSVMRDCPSVCCIEQPRSVLIVVSSNWTKWFLLLQKKKKIKTTVGDGDLTPVSLPTRLSQQA